MRVKSPMIYIFNFFIFMFFQLLEWNIYTETKRSYVWIREISCVSFGINAVPVCKYKRIADVCRDTYAVSYWFGNRNRISEGDVSTSQVINLFVIIVSEIVCTLNEVRNRCILICIGVWVQWLLWYICQTVSKTYYPGIIIAGSA